MFVGDAAPHPSRRPPLGALLLGLAAWAAFGAVAAVALVGCPSAAAFDGSVYRKDGVVFRVPPRPPEWRPIQVDAASLAFRDEAHEASVLVNGRCPADDAPLLALTNHLIMGTTEREILDQRTIPLDAREALFTRMHAKLDGVPMLYDIYVLKKDGCVYDFVYVAPPERGDDGVAAFERFVEGFRAGAP
jgi:hypothetical protein